MAITTNKVQGNEGGNSEDGLPPLILNSVNHLFKDVPEPEFSMRKEIEAVLHEAIVPTALQIEEIKNKYPKEIWMDYVGFCING